MSTAQREIRRYIILELTGDMDDVHDAIDAIQACGREGLANVEAFYYGCDACGCNNNGSPTETQPCEDELCGCDCEGCGCIDFEE